MHRPFAALAANIALTSIPAHAAAADKDSANWLLHARDYSNQRFSPASRINRGNVKKLVPKWIYQTGISATFQTTPLVADGVMYLSTPFSNVVAVDARSGRELWRYEQKRSAQKLCCGPANRAGDHTLWLFVHAARRHGRHGAAGQRSARDHVGSVTNRPPHPGWDSRGL